MHTGANWLRAERWVVIILTLAACSFAFWNLKDEMTFLEAAFWDYCLAWSFSPAINALVGVWARRPGLLRTCTVLAVLYAWFYSHYALNGSTRDRQGAEHMHVDLVPVLSFVLFGLVHGIGIAIPGMRRVINAPFRGS